MNVCRWHRGHVRILCTIWTTWKVKVGTFLEVQWVKNQHCNGGAMSWIPGQEQGSHVPRSNEASQRATTGVHAQPRDYLTSCNEDLTEQIPIFFKKKAKRSGLTHLLLQIQRAVQTSGSIPAGVSRPAWHLCSLTGPYPALYLNSHSRWGLWCVGIRDPRKQINRHDTW